MVDLQAIAEALGKHRKTGNGYDVCCPVHNEKNPSMSISLGNDGQLLAHCHSCRAEYVDIARELEGRGLLEKREIKEHPEENKPVYTEYEVKDKTGKLISKKIRVKEKGKKKFMFWKPKLKKLGLLLENMPLYCIEKIKGAGVVVLTEGEKACDALRARGIDAVSLVGGSETKYNPEIFKDLQGHTVELWPDNDHNGRSCMKTISEYLDEYQIPNRFIDWSEAPKKGDSYDFFLKGNVAEFKNLPRKAELDSQWYDGLQRTKEDKLVLCDSNLSYILQRHPALLGKFGYDTRAHNPVVLSEIAKVTDKKSPYPHPITESEILRLTQWITNITGIKASFNKVALLIRPVCLMREVSRQFDPFRDYLEGLKWDGVSRLENCLIEQAGAESSEYVRKVTRSTMIAAVARTYHPGCKVDNMLILVGNQGLGKSSLFRALLPEDKYFTDHIPNLNDKDAKSQLHGLVFIEIAELEAFSNAETAAIKSFLTAQIDRFRPPYGKTPQDFPRTCVFVGSTNSNAFLKDVTGARRFWPVAVNKEIDVSWFVKNRDQLWAEARELYEQKVIWWLDKDASKEQEDIANSYQVELPLEELVMKYVTEFYSDSCCNEQSFYEEGIRVKTTTLDIIKNALKNENGIPRRYEEIMVGKILTKAGWTRKRERVSGDDYRPYFYYAPDEHIKKMRVKKGLPEERPVKKEEPYKTEEPLKDNVVDFTKAVQQVFDIEEKPKEDLSGPIDY